MADRSIKMTELQAILKRYGVIWDATRGKGSHGSFVKTSSKGTIAYTVPTHGKDVAVWYVRGCRKRFGLCVEDKVSDEDFYGK